MLEYFNELKMIKKPEYIIAKGNKSLAEHLKNGEILVILIELY